MERVAACVLDHVPHMVDDTGWGHRGRAWSTGYIKALVDAVRALA
jgi:mannonate dehydratase